MYTVEKESSPENTSCAQENAELNTEFEKHLAHTEEWDIEAAVSVAVPVEAAEAIMAINAHRPPHPFPHGVILLICFCTLLVGLVLLEVFVFNGISL